MLYPRRLRNVHGEQAMRFIINGAILGVVLVTGLGPPVVEPAGASAQGRTGIEVKSESPLARIIKRDYS